MNRDYTGPAFYAEPMFDYLNRSARLESERIRNLLEQWFKHFPSKAQDELRARFRLKDNRYCNGIAQELLPAYGIKTKHPLFRPWIRLKESM